MKKLLSGQLPITEDIAFVLKDELGGTYTFWLKREENYRTALERIPCLK